MKRTPHAEAVLQLFDKLTAEGYTVISANTDEQAEPQIFAQSEAGELAFFFVRTDREEPTAEARARLLALASKHGVAAYICQAPLAGTDGLRVRPL